MKLFHYLWAAFRNLTRYRVLVRFKSGITRVYWLNTDQAVSLRDGVWNDKETTRFLFASKTFLCFGFNTTIAVRYRDIEFVELF